MKKYLFIFLFFFVFFKSFSQNISVELSTIWKKTEKKRWNKIRLAQTPYLILKYTNLCDKPIYMLKPSSSFDFSVNFMICSNEKELIDKKYLNKLQSNYTNKKFEVVISGISDLNSKWVVLDDGQNYWEEYESSFQNLYLQNIYSNFYKDFRPNKQNHLSKDNIFIINKDSISEEFKHHFLFLEKSESLIISYDLTGFQVLGGNYTFKLSTDESKNYVETTNSWDENQKMWIYKKEFLPLIVNGFNLYEGKINTNEISIKFGSLKKVILNKNR